MTRLGRTASGFYVENAVQEDTVRKDYSRGIRVWKDFLQNTPIVNIDGLLGGSMGECIRDSIVSATLWRFFGWLVEKQTPFSQFKKMLSSVIHLHSTRGQFMSKIALKGVWKLYTKAYTLRVIKDKEWIDLGEMQELHREFFTLPETRVNVCLQVCWELTQDGLFRPKSFCCERSASTPRLMFERIRWTKVDNRTSVNIKLRERCSANPKWQATYGAGVDLTSWTKFEAMKFNRWGLVNALSRYRDLAVVNEKGPLKWAKGRKVLISWWRSQLGRISKQVIGKVVTPAILRRSVFQCLVHTQEKEKIAKLARHLEVTTHQKYYQHISPEERQLLNFRLELALRSFNVNRTKNKNRPDSTRFRNCGGGSGKKNKG